MSLTCTVFDLNPFHLALVPPSGVTPLLSCLDIWHQKTKESLGVVCLILGLAVFVQYRRVTDGQTDKRTHDDSIHRSSIASHGKNQPTAKKSSKRYITPTFSSNFSSASLIFSCRNFARSIYLRLGMKSIKYSASGLASIRSVISSSNQSSVA